jgi:hypothetical protein
MYILERWCGEWISINGRMKTFWWGCIQSYLGFFPVLSMYDMHKLISKVNQSILGGLASILSALNFGRIAGGRSFIPNHTPFPVELIWNSSGVVRVSSSVPLWTSRSSRTIRGIISNVRNSPRTFVTRRHHNQKDPSISIGYNIVRIIFFKSDVSEYPKNHKVLDRGSSV